MAKKGVYEISGNTSPKVGEKTFYKIEKWYPDTSFDDRNPAKVTWELFVERGHGFESTNIKKKGINHFTFGAKAYQFMYRIEGYLYKPEGKPPMSIIVHPQKNNSLPKEKDKEILGIHITYRDGTNITKILSYRDWLKATARCEGMEGEKIIFTLWEDDSEKAGHNKNNQYITQSIPIEVNKYGKAVWIFPLSPTFISLASKKEGGRKQHEYYVTAEYNGKTDASGNINVSNPDYRPSVSMSIPPKTGTANPSSSRPKILPRKDTPKASTEHFSHNNKADSKGNIIQIRLADVKGKAFIKTPKFGETIQVIIEGINLAGKKYNLRIWEHDLIGNHDLLYNEIHTFKADQQILYTPLTKQMEQTGDIGNDTKHPDRGEYTGEWIRHQEIFAEVIFLYVSSTSSTIHVGLDEKPRPIQYKKSPAKVEKVEKIRTNSICLCQQYNLIWGQKVNCEFRKKVVQICKDLWGDANKIKMANNLMAVFQWESGGTFKSDAPNQANSGGTGLVQFMPKTAKSLLGKEITIEVVKNYYGKKFNKITQQKEDWYLNRVKEFADMTAVQQLDFVKKYFEPLKNKNVEFIDFYLQVLFPASCGLPEHVVFADSLNKLDRPFENDKLKNQRVIAYNNNKGMDLNKDGKLTKSEIKISVQKYLTEGLIYAKIDKCENVGDKKPSTLIGKCTEGKIVNGFINNHLVTIHKIDSCNKNTMTKKVEIIVLHRTAGGAASGTLTHMKNKGYGAHFVIDYDGTVYQTIGLNKKGSHMGIAQFQSTKNAGWGNSNSIGIETCGYSYDRDGNRRIGSKYDKIPHHHWELVTDQQAKAVACLLEFLLHSLNLSINDIKVHEKLCSKEANEGQDVYNAMLPYFNKKQ